MNKVVGVLLLIAARIGEIRAGGQSMERKTNGKRKRNGNRAYKGQIARYYARRRRLILAAIAAAGVS